jgi:uncharacterized protein (DUF1697 family)
LSDCDSLIVDAHRCRIGSLNLQSTIGNYMAQYIALIRAINVGKRVVKMAELAKLCESCGLKNVRTYIQSGNVVFETSQTSPAGIKRKIQTHLTEALGYKVEVILTTATALAAIVKGNPFRRFEGKGDVMLFVSFFAADPTSKPKLPLISTAENLDVFAVRNNVAFIVSRRKKNGWFGFPNLFVEKQFGVSATTRNWSVVKKLAEFAARQI